MLCSASHIRNGNHNLGSEGSKKHLEWDAGPLWRHKRLINDCHCRQPSIYISSLLSRVYSDLSSVSVNRLSPKLKWRANKTPTWRRRNPRGTHSDSSSRPTGAWGCWTARKPASAGRCAECCPCSCHYSDLAVEKQWVVMLVSLIYFSNPSSQGMRLLQR